jgi:NAD(P)H-dependent flavin oxidoreductase YrpB (nitropropane dioxygenase family)
LKLTEKGEPLYGPRDAVDPEAMRELGLPFWLAGSYADPGRLKEALAQGAAGIQVGTFFAYCEESGLAEGVKQGVLGNLLKGGAEIFTDPKASPTGFPFKVVRLEESLSEPSEYQERPRICNLGYLRTVFKRKDGSIGYRCPGEPVDSYLQKEGNREETEGKKCVCNGLMAAIGLAQNQRSGYRERPLITSGDALSRLGGFLAGRTLPYHAADVVKWLLSGPSEEGAGPAAGSLGALGPSP